MPYKKSKRRSKKKLKLKAKHREPVKIKRRQHRYSIKKVLLTDMTKPSGVKENPFIIKNRAISNRVTSLIIGIQQPIINLLNLNKDTWFKQWCDPVTKTIYMEVYNKPD